MVENRDVAKKMVEFGRKLETVSDEKLPIKSLKKPSIQIAHECRALISESWKVKLFRLSKEDFAL